MAIGERFRSGGARGIARFLADHQRCDAGFDVRRDESGSGRLRITCLGCGQAVDYRAAEAGELAAGLPVDLADNGQPGVPAGVPAPPPPAAPADATSPPPATARPPADPAAPPPRGWPASPPPAGRVAPSPGIKRRLPGSERRRSRLPGWVPVLVIGALIVGGLAMIAIGVLRDDGEEGPAPSPTQTAREGAASEGSQGPAGVQAGGGQGGQGAGRGQAQPSPGATPPRAGSGSPSATGGVSLRRRRFADRFEIGVPSRWNHGTEDGAIKITARGATAELNVFFEAGERPAEQLARAAKDFLAGRHEAGQVGKRRPVRLGSRRGMRVQITYPGGEEVAVVMSAKGFSYLVLRRIDRGASADIGRQAEAALASFRPG